MTLETIMKEFLAAILLGLGVTVLSAQEPKAKTSNTSDDDWKAQVFDLQEKIKRKPESPGFHSQLAELLLSHQDRAGALEEFLQAARLAPDDKELLNRLAQVLYDGGDNQAAATQLRALIDQKPDASDVHLELARFLAEEWLLAAAIAESKEALRVDPANADAKRNLDYELKQKEKGDQRITALQNQIASRRAKATSFMELAFLLYLNDSNPEGALQAVRQGLKRYPHDTKLKDYEKLLMVQAGVR